MGSISTRLSGQVPSNLKVTSATSTQTQLTWAGSPGSYVVQRAPVGGAFTNLATVSATSYTDSTVDSYLQFTYQIVGANSATSVSNTVTVGPPLAGLSLVAQAPLAGTSPSQYYGENPSVAVDSNGDPGVAFLWVNPTGNDNSGTLLLFRNWNRASASWNPIVTVGKVGDISTNFHQPLSLGFDATSKTWGIATEDDGANLRVYTSADGASWSLKKTYTASVGPWQGPSMVLAGGNLYLAAQQDNAGIQYITGKLSDPGTWTTRTSPAVSGVGLAQSGVGPSLAIDQSGNPGIAYWCSPKSGNNETLLYWRPASTNAPVKITDSQNQQSNYAVKMLYYNLNPRVAFYAIRQDSTVNLDGIHFVRSDDGGATWTLPVVQIPPDGGASTDYPFDLALNSKGSGMIVFGENSGDGTSKCGAPQISRSSDLNTWTTCSPVSSFGDYGANPQGINAAFQGNDKAYIFWWNPGTDPATTGVVMYREKPDNQPSGPLISSVQDAESAQTNVVQGEWIAIYGANLAGTSRAWNANDFSGNNLPKSLSGVSVSFNGIPAAVYYVSPGQIDAQVPNGISGTVPVVVTNQGAVSAAFSANVVANAPSLYVYPANGKLYPAATHVDGSLIGDPAVIGNAGTKAKAGETIVLYVNGLASSPSGVITGGIAYSGDVSVTFQSASGARVSVNASYAGLSFAGGFQANVVLPALPAGDYLVSLTTQGVTSPGSVTLPVGP